MIAQTLKANTIYPAGDYRVFLVSQLTEWDDLFNCEDTALVILATIKSEVRISRNELITQAIMSDYRRFRNCGLKLTQDNDELFRLIEITQLD